LYYSLAHKPPAKSCKKQVKRLGAKRKHLQNTKKNTFFHKYQKIEKIKNKNSSFISMVLTKTKQSLKRLSPKPQAHTEKTHENTQ
jgi:hypothetical protein